MGARLGPRIPRGTEPARRQPRAAVAVNRALGQLPVALVVRTVTSEGTSVLGPRRGVAPRPRAASARSEGASEAAGRWQVTAENVPVLNPSGKVSPPCSLAAMRAVCLVSFKTDNEFAGLSGPWSLLTLSMGLTSG